MNCRAVLTEVGADGEALREQDRDATLFDLGLGASHVDLCIRVADPRTAAAAAGACRTRAVRAGQSGDGPDPRGEPASRVREPAWTHRGLPADSAGRRQSPEGPHTHVLPKLLQHRRTHSATELVPDGWIPCAHLYPAHPAKDSSGRQPAV